MDGDKVTQDESSYCETGRLGNRLFDVMEKFAWLKDGADDSSISQIPSRNSSFNRSTTVKKNASFSQSMKSWKKRNFFRSVWQRVIKKKKRDKNARYTIVKSEDIEELLGVCYEVWQFLSENQPLKRPKTITDADIVTVWDHEEHKEKLNVTDEEEEKYDIALAIGEGILKTVAPVSEKETEWVEVKFETVENVQTSWATFGEPKGNVQESNFPRQEWSSQNVKDGNNKPLTQINGSMAKDPWALQVDTVTINEAAVVETVEKVVNSENFPQSFAVNDNKADSLRETKIMHERDRILSTFDGQKVSVAEDEFTVVKSATGREMKQETNDISPMETANEITDSSDKEKSWHLDPIVCSKISSSKIAINVDANEITSDSQICLCCRQCQTLQTDESYDWGSLSSLPNESYYAEESGLGSLNLSKKNEDDEVESSLVFMSPKWMNEFDPSILDECPTLKLTTHSVAESSSIVELSAVNENCPEKLATKCSTECSLKKPGNVGCFAKMIRDVALGNYFRHWAELFIYGIYNRLMKRFW